MIYVYSSLTINRMEDISDEFIEVYRDKIKNASKKGSIPITVKMNDGDTYLFMTCRYYSQNFSRGRREGVDFIDVSGTGRIYQGK